MAVEGQNIISGGPELLSVHEGCDLPFTSVNGHRVPEMVQTLLQVPDYFSP